MRVYVMIDCALCMGEKTGTGLQVWLQISGWRKRSSSMTVCKYVYVSNTSQ